MKKFSSIMKMLAIVPASFIIGSLPAMAQNSTQPWVMELTRDSANLPYNCNYTGTDKDGNIYGFQVDESYIECYDEETDSMVQGWGPTYVRSIGVIAKNPSSMTTLSFPDSFTYKEDTRIYSNLVVNEIQYNFNYGETKSFPGMDNLKDINIPASVSLIYVSGHDLFDYINFNMPDEFKPTSENIRLENNADEWIKFYVPDDKFMAYDAAIGSKNYILCSTTPAKAVYINVDKPGTLALRIYEFVSDLNSVRWAVVTGTPNNEDIRVFRRMYRLETLDLSGVTDLKVFEQCGDLRYLENVILPDCIEEVGEMALYNCTNLVSIRIPDSVKIIGPKAFQYCKRLKQVQLSSSLTEIKDEAFHQTNIVSLDLPVSVKKIGNNAFSYSSLTFVDLSKVEIIGGEAFSRCNLENIDLSNLISLDWYGFGYCEKLKSVKFGDKLKIIPNLAFIGCDLTSLVIPDNIMEIGGDAFLYNNFQSIELGSGIKSIGNNAFLFCFPSVVICKIPFPLDYNGFESRDNLINTTLYVPELTLNAYLLHDNWTNFPNIQPIPDFEIKEFTVDQPFKLISNKGVATDANITNVSKLEIDRDYPLSLGKYFHGDNGMSWEMIGSTKNISLLNKSDVYAKEVEIGLNLEPDRWHFLSFPFDVKVGNIIVDNNNPSTLWVVRKYSGEDRAKLSDNTWQNMKDNDILKAGEGYIFHCTNVDDNWKLINFQIAAHSNPNAIFSRDELKTNLHNYPSEFAHNDSWNLIGNNYPCYVNIKGIDFDAPITVWRSSDYYGESNYYAYSPIDDDLILYPFEAFFVQRQDWDGGDVLTIKPEARAVDMESAHELYSAQSLVQTRANNERALFNLHINGEKGHDRVRAVVNEEAAFGYERNRDAAKFMNPEATATQIYILNDNVKMAIDERPLGNGDFILGARFGQSGTYTFTMDTKNADNYQASLLDLKTGITTDLTKADYEFKAEEGINDHRFILNLRGMDVASVDDISAENLMISVEGNRLTISSPEAVDISVLAADGKVISNTHSNNYSVTLQNGVYIVKAGENISKVLIGK